MSEVERRRRDRLPVVLSLTALAVALLGSTPVGEAAREALVPRASVGTAQLRDGAVTTAKVRDGSLLARDFRAGELGGETFVVTATERLVDRLPYAKTVSCPAGHVALAGGVWAESPGRLYTMGSAPVTAGASQPPPADRGTPVGWVTFVEPAVVQTVIWYAVCQRASR